MTSAIKELSRFFIKISTITVVLILSVVAVFSFFLPQYYTPILPLEILFIALTTLGLHSVLYKAASKSFAAFIRSFMLLTFIKLIAYLIFITVYLAFSKKQPAVFVAVFFIAYIIFTIVETIDLLKLSKENSKKTS